MIKFFYDVQNAQLKKYNFIHFIENFGQAIVETHKVSELFILP